MNYPEIAKKIIYFMLVCLSSQVCCLPRPAFSQAPPDTLKVAIIPHRSNLGNEQAYSTFFSELSKTTGLHFAWLGSKTYDDVVHKMKTAEADIGYVGPFAYVDAQDSSGVKIICRTLSENNEEFYHSMIITRRDSGIRDLRDLKGKSFSFTDPKSTSGYLFPMAQLKASGIRKEDFREVRFLKRHANSLLAVYKGHVDAGATSITAVDKVDINMDEIQILWQSEPIYRGLWIARKDLPEKQFETIQKAMLQMNTSGKKEEIFKELITKGFVMGKDSDYDNVRQVIQWMQEN